MSYPKKQDKPSSKAPSTKISPEKKERLLAIQQREQLKGMIANKFLEKYGNKNQNAEMITREVANFIKTEKVTEDNLKKLEERIKKLHKGETDSKSQKGELNPPSNPNTKSQSQTMKAKILEGRQDQQDRQGSNTLRDSNRNDDNVSVASSMMPKSVYQFGNEDDEWALIMKFDNELYKKERELEQFRDKEQKKKMMGELDKQLKEKDFLKSKDNEETKLYNDVQNKQLELMDKKSKQKNDDMKNKIMHEKMSRDKQLQDEYDRKKFERKKEKEIDELLVQKIKQELEMEKDLIKQRKMEEKDHLQKVLKENEENKKRLQEIAIQEKLADIKAQQEYTNLIEKQERERETELKMREEKAKNFMAMMTDTVVKDQKNKILGEGHKILQHYQDREEREKHEDERKRQKLLESKREMKEFLDRQVEEKKQKEKLDQDLNNKQAEFWKSDAENYFENEKKKLEFIRDVNKKHAGILQQQTNESKQKKGKKGGNIKMNVDELLQNKALLKEIAHKNEDLNVQRNFV